MRTQYLIQMLVLLNTIELEGYNPFERCQTYWVSAAYLQSLGLPIFEFSLFIRRSCKVKDWKLVQNASNF